MRPSMDRRRFRKQSNQQTKRRACLPICQSCHKSINTRDIPTFETLTVTVTVTELLRKCGRHKETNRRTICCCCSSSSHMQAKRKVYWRTVELFWQSILQTSNLRLFIDGNCSIITVIWIPEEVDLAQWSFLAVVMQFDLIRDILYNARLHFDLWLGT